MSEPNTPKGPVVLEIESTDLPAAPSPAEAPPPADPDFAPSAEATAGARAIAAAGRGGRFGLVRALMTAIGGLVLLWLGVSVADFVADLIARQGWLGWAALALAAAVVVLLLAIIVREFAALARLGRIEDIRDKALEAAESGSTQSAQTAMKGLIRLYRGRPDLDWARDRLRQAEADTPDVGARLEIAEHELLTGLDARAESAVSRASRDVAAATALMPLAFIDVLAALTVNLRMVREIAEIYGGRAGWLGSWRLMRAVAAHLVATGAVAVADDLLGPLVGGGVLAKLSRRFGEGAINGALTARVGVAAIEVCRPLPFVARARPSASGIVMNALRGWRGEEKPPSEPPMT